MMAGPNDGDVPAPTEALFGTTQAHLPEPRSNTSLVFGVAGAALAAGIVGGFLFLKTQARTNGEIDTRTSFVPAASSSAPLAAEPSPPPDKDEQPTVAQPTAPSLDAGADAADAAPVAADAAVERGTVSGAGRTGEPEAPPDASAAPASDAGWQKPDWAKPDNEIPVRRGPGEADDTIVIPKEE
jgi:hypothetical protein